MKTTIYALRENGFVRYVGKTTKSLESRLASHLDGARKGEKTRKATWIRSMLRKGQLPCITLIGEYDGNGNKEEIAWIKYFRDRGVDLVNGTNGGDGGVMLPHIIAKIAAKNKGRRWTSEQRRKLSIQRMGHFTSEETKKKIRLSQINKFIPLYQRKKMSASHKGKVFSEKTKEKMSLVHKKRMLDSEVRRRFIEAGRKSSPFVKGHTDFAHNKGRKHSEISKHNMSVAHLGQRAWNKGLKKGEV